MSSEAAQKAYPKEEYGSFAPYMHEGFDRGAVEALRQAADMIRRAGEMGGPEWIDRMADDWVVEQ